MGVGAGARFVTRRTRVLRVIGRMNVGGPAWQVATLTERLDGDRFEQRLMVGNVGGGEMDYIDLRCPELPVVRVDGLGRSIRPWSDLRALLAVIAEIRRFRPDVVHTHTAKAGVIGRIAAIVTRTPIVVHTFHGHLLHGYFSPRRTAAVRWIERVLARRTTSLVAVGAQVRDDLLGAGIGRNEQYVVVPPGVELARVGSREAARELLELPNDRIVIAYVARLTAIKRPDRLLEVVRWLDHRHDLLFVVAGGGDALDELTASASDLPVRFLGWRGDIENVYAAADIVILTSDNEGMPVSLIEAAAAGRPAVTTAAGSAAEVVLDGVTGFVTAFDSDALAGAVARLADDPALRARFGAAAHDRYLERFHVSGLVDATADLYDLLMAGLDTRGAARR